MNVSGDRHEGARAGHRAALALLGRPVGRPRETRSTRERWTHRSHPHGVRRRTAVSRPATNPSPVTGGIEIRP
jgi:hypothetical protein